MSANYRLAVALLCCATAAPPAFSATSTTTFSVTATVVSLCAVAASPMAFGNYSAAQLDASSAITVTCTNGTSYSVGLNAGTGSGATVSSRKMTGPSTLNYGIYQDAARTTLLGNTVSADTLSGTGSGSAQALNVYGRIPAGQYPDPGVYADTITVTVTY